MLSTLLNIVVPVFALAAVGYAFGRRQARTPDMSFINYANVMVFVPALVFSALVANPVDLVHGWPLVAAGVLIILLPGILLAFVRGPQLARPAFLMVGMFRNTGNIGIPLMMLAYGKDLLGDIIVLFVLSNLLHFSVGLFVLTKGRDAWMWLRNPNIWAAVMGVAFGMNPGVLPPFVLTALEMLGQIAVPLMLFSLGVRLSQDRIDHLGLALRINGLYLIAGALSLVIVITILPLTPEWTRLVALSVMLPPAVLNYLLCEHYKVEPRSVASVVLMGNLLSVVTIPLVVWLTLMLV